ncbi:MAG: phosphotransferase, partial [Mycobacterium sp.]|nr:phosphotransferase [Mycobacterium sp.]
MSYVVLVRIETPGDLTAEWLTETLRSAPVTAFETERIGTGQMSECYRVTLQYDRDDCAGSGAGPASVVLKVAAADPTSRQTGLAMGLYEKEVRFYTDIAPRLSGPIAACHHTAFDPATGVFDLLLDDAAPARQGDEIRGASIEQALLAVTELGRVQGPLLGDPDLAAAPWLNQGAPVSQDLIAALYTGFLDRYGPT